MKRRLFAGLIFGLFIQISIAQVTLNANESRNTYEDINAVLAPGYNVIEVPDCNHA